MSIQQTVDGLPLNTLKEERAIPGQHLIVSLILIHTSPPALAVAVYANALDQSIDRAIALAYLASRAQTFVGVDVL